MNWGVAQVALDPFDTDPNECKISQLCEKATTDNGGTKSWVTGEAEGYVAVAKEYGLACSTRESAICVETKPVSCSDAKVCKKAIYTVYSEHRWKAEYNLYFPFVVEA